MTAVINAAAMPAYKTRTALPLKIERKSVRLIFVKIRTGREVLYTSEEAAETNASSSIFICLRKIPRRMIAKTGATTFTLKTRLSIR